MRRTGVAAAAPGRASDARHGRGLRQSVVVTERAIEFVVDPGGGADGAAVLRACLSFVADRARRAECDVPDEPDRPPAVAAAAATLLRVARHPHRRPPATGVIELADPLVREAFVAFAPHALDGSVWDRDGGLLVTFADEAGSIVVRLDDESATRLAAHVSPAALVPVSEWRARPRDA